MPFEWNVPIANANLGALDEAIAKGVAPADVSKLFDSYFGGRDAAYKSAGQSAFSGGLPRNPDGSVDYTKAADILLQTQGVQGVPGALGLANQAELQKLPPIPYPGVIPTTPAPATPGPQSELPPSIQRQVAAAEPDGQPLRPGQQGNLTSPSEVPGTAQVSVDGGPQEPLEQGRKALAFAPAQSDAMPPQFAKLPTEPSVERPVSGPPANRFAQAPTSQMPAIPTPATGSYGPNEIARQDAIANWALEMARRADLAGSKSTADTYRAAATQAQARAQAMRDAALKVETKQGETRVEQEKGIFDESRKNFLASKDVNFQLDTIDKDIKNMGPDWLGSGANARAKLARTYNTALQFVPETLRNELRLDQIDPEKIASWESFNKASQKLGFALAKSLGSREAMQIVQAATASVPNAEQTYWGARLVSAGMRQAAQRESDFHQYVIGLMRNNQSTLDADVTFNQKNPVSKYVNNAASVVPPQPAIDYLRANPTRENKLAFEKKYHDGALIGVFGTGAK
jgi:hypothetical protein